MKVKTCAFFTVFALIFPLVFLRYSTVRPVSTGFRAAIVVLTRGQTSRLLNTLHSIEYFYPQAIGRYPVVIFFDPHGTRIRRRDVDLIRSCVKLKVIFQEKILFDLILNGAETIDRIHREFSHDEQRPIGWRFKSQFWSHTVFHHPTIRNHYDFIMRLDDDSVFLRPLPVDFFRFAFENRLDYIYRAVETNEKSTGTNAFLREKIEFYRRICRKSCLQFESNQMLDTSFFVTNLRIWSMPNVEELFQHLLANDTILTESLDDRTIHPVVLTLTSNVNRVRLVRFAYAHNFHLYDEKTDEFVHHRWFEHFVNRTSSNCRQLLIIDPVSKHLKSIEMK